MMIKDSERLKAALKGLYGEPQDEFSVKTDEVIQRQIEMFGAPKDTVLRDFDKNMDIYGSSMQVLGRLSDVQERINLSSMTPAEKEESRKAINVVKMILDQRVLDKDEVGRPL